MATRSGGGARGGEMNGRGKAALFLVYLAVHLSALLTASAASQRDGRRYLNSTAVTLSELIKVVTSIMAMGVSEANLASALFQTLFAQPSQLLRVCLPALLYTIQNNVTYAALTHLDALTFQITYQLKIVASLLSVWLLLRRAVSTRKALAAIMLTIGVSLVQLAKAEEPDDGEKPAASSASSSAASSSGASSSSGAASSSGGAGSSSAPPASQASAPSDDGSAPKKNRYVGVLGVLLACACSGLAGAMMELLLKSSAHSLPRRNLQVAFISLILACAHMWSMDQDKLREGGFFQGYTPIVWGMITLDSLGGLLVSILLKYTSSMLKNFAAPLGIILNVIFSRYASRSAKPLSQRFMAGTALVVAALGLYTSDA